MREAVRIWARPGSSHNRINWDPWRKRWVVACTEAAVQGRANEAIATLVARWLGIPRAQVRWKTVTHSPSKRLEIEGLSSPEIARRLTRASENLERPRQSD